MTDLSALEKKLGVIFANKDLLAKALVHRSYLNENRRVSESNERLEFLGDSVLSVLTSHFLYEKYPQFAEGMLTNLRSRLVRGKTLAQAAKTLGISDFLKLSRGEDDCGGRQNEAILADAFEAVIGAVYLDQGLTAVEKLLHNVLFCLTDEIVENGDAYDYKSRIQEIIQEKFRVTPKYQLVNSVGPDHEKTFTVSILVGDKSYGEGTGKSKHEAEQQAAKVAIGKLNV